jgi:hypothetical protein
MCQFRGVSPAPNLSYHQASERSNLATGTACREVTGQASQLRSRSVINKSRAGDRPARRTCAVHGVSHDVTLKAGRGRSRPWMVSARFAPVNHGGRKLPTGCLGAGRWRSRRVINPPSVPAGERGERTREGPSRLESSSSFGHRRLRIRVRQPCGWYERYCVTSS